MTVRRSAALLVAAGLAAAVSVWPALPAAAHGAPVRPVSRTAACAPDSADAGSPACRAALKANGRAFGSFDNLRRAGVRGRDRQVVPDGRLCSGGLPDFGGLDLARDDWPASTLTGGGTFDMRYRATIPHRGTFRIYLTRADYRPGTPLRWRDLQSQPVLTVTDPPLRDGAYRISGRLPADRTGRHLLYTVWQTSDTPDTYYSCSDVVLTAAAGAVGRGATPQPSATQTPSNRPAGRQPSGGPVSSDAGVPAASGAAVAPRSAPDAGTGGWLGPPQRVAAQNDTWGPTIVSAVLVVLVAVTAGMAVGRIRASRGAQGTHRRTEKR